MASGIALTGPALQDRRRRLRFTQEAVAGILGVSRRRVTAIEGQARPSKAAVRRYLAALAELEAQEL